MTDLPTLYVPLVAFDDESAPGKLVNVMAYANPIEHTTPYVPAARALNLEVALLESQAALAAAEEGRLAALDIAKGAYEARDALRPELQAANARADKYAETIAEHTVPLDQFTDMEQERDALRAQVARVTAERGWQRRRPMDAETCGRLSGLFEAWCAVAAERDAEMECYRRSRGQGGGEYWKGVVDTTDEALARITAIAAKEATRDE